MKYALIVVIALIILRIDMFVGVVERAWDKIPQFKKDTPQELVNESVPVSTFSISESDGNQTSQFKLLITEFSYHPDQGTRKLLVDYLTSNLAMQSISENELFIELEKWLPHIESENVELVLLLNELLTIFKEKNLTVIRQFYANYLDVNPEFFFHYFPLSLDPNCITAKYSWSPNNTLRLEQSVQRLKNIQELEGKIPKDKENFWKGCLLVLRVEVSKGEG